MDEVTKRFCIWLEVNGAKFPKIDWPRVVDDEGVRGGIATETIEV